MQSPIARAEFVAVKRGEADRNVEICLFPPEPDPESERGDHRCRIEMKGLSESVYSYGVDSLQALSLSLFHIHQALHKLEHAGWDMTTEGKTEAQSSLLSSYFPYFNKEGGCDEKSV